MAHYIPEVTDNNDISNEDFIRVGLSHIPILTNYATFPEKVQNILFLLEMYSCLYI